jgi:Secretion system C-terminal sorting domain
MKKILVLLTMLLLSAYMHAQIVTVNPGNGTLKAAINSAVDGDILVLSAGSTYNENTDTAIFVTKKITIQSDNSSSAKPIIKNTVATAANGKTSYYFMVKGGAALSLNGLEFDGTNNSGNQVSRLIRFLEDASQTEIGTIRLDNCLVHNLTKDVLDGNSALAGLILIDSIFIKNTFTHDTGPVCHLKNVDCKYVEATNSTFTNFNDYGFRIMGIYGQSYFATVVLDHITMDNVLYTSNNKLYFIWSESIPKPYSVTNSIFSNTWLDTPRVLKGLYWKNCTAGVTYNHNITWMDGAKGWGSSAGTPMTVSDTMTADPQYSDTANRLYKPLNSVFATYDVDGKPIGDQSWFPLTGIKDIPAVVTSYDLAQNYPNPFNPNTNIQFSLKQSGMVNISVYNTLGEKVAVLVNQRLEEGKHEVNFNAASLPSGLYIYSLNTNNTTLTKKMLLLK